MHKSNLFFISLGKHFSDVGFGTGDVLGCLIKLPEPAKNAKLPNTCKDKPLIKFKSFLYFEEKDEVAAALKQLQPLEGSKVVFYKNGLKIGTAFTDLYDGIYYPSAGLYKNISITFNFGPDFAYPPTDSEYATCYRAMHEAVFEAQIEQTLADIVYLVENEDNLKLNIFYQNN